VFSSYEFVVLFVRYHLVCKSLVSIGAAGVHVILVVVECYGSNAPTLLHSNYFRSCWWRWRWAIQN